MEAAVVNCVQPARRRSCSSPAAGANAARHRQRTAWTSSPSSALRQGRHAAAARNGAEAAPNAVAVFSTLCDTPRRRTTSRRSARSRRTPAVLCVDGISGLVAMEYHVDDWKVDVASPGRKALMLLPGLAYVSVSDKAKQKIEANKTAPFYFFDLSAT
jgi:aspartate aminotransferase-like enzyme